MNKSPLQAYIDIRRNIFEMELMLKDIEQEAIDEALNIILYKKDKAKTKKDANSQKVLDNNEFMVYLQFRKSVTEDDELKSVKAELKEKQKLRSQEYHYEIEELYRKINQYKNDSYCERLTEFISNLEEELTVTKPTLSLKFK